MKGSKGYLKTFVAFTVAFIMLLSLMAFPHDAYGDDLVKVAIKTVNGNYLCAENGGGSDLTANREAIGEWETFEMVDLEDGYVALKGSNGQYVNVSDDGKKVYVNSNRINDNQKLKLIRLGGNKVAFKADNNKYLCAEDGGGGKVVADRTAIGSWETFELIDLSDDDTEFTILGNIALMAENGKYLCAEDGGGDDVVADRDEIGSWETFEVIQTDRNTVVFKTTNGKYLYLEDEDYGEINAEASKISDRTKFIFYNLGNHKVALKANNGRFLALEDEDEILANSKEINKWSTFKVFNAEDSNSDKCKLTATAGDRSISFTWTKPSNTKNIIGYNLYRGTASGKQSSTPITDFPIEGTSYTDRNVESGTKYYYILKAVYKDKSLGAASNEVSVELQSAIELSAKTVDSGVYLAWNSPDDRSNIIGYNLYRATASGKQSNTPITDFPIETTYYTDKNVDNNTTYHYIAKAVYRDKTLGLASNEVKVKSGSNHKIIVLEVGSKYMYVGGQRKEVDPGKGTTVLIKNGRTFLPIRALVEAMGGEIEWDPDDKKVSIYLGNDRIYLWIGEKTAKVNGKNKESDVAPYILNGRTRLPLRFIVENLGCEAGWDGITKRVTIKVK